MFALRAILLLSSLTHFLAEIDPREVRRRLDSDLWASHLPCLLTSGLVIAITEGEVKNVARYFAIPKKRLARAIFNGKAMSAGGAAPPPTNLPDVTVLLRALADMSRDAAGVSMSIGDIRHYFHQLPLSKQISAYFCILFEKVFYRWRSLPMGHSWSPQSVAMGLLLVTLKKAGYDVDADKGPWARVRAGKMRTKAHGLGLELVRCVQRASPHLQLFI